MTRYNITTAEARAREGSWVDWVLVWVFLFGVWPLAHPAHDAGSLMSCLDLALHVGAGIALATRWKVVRR